MLRVDHGADPELVAAVDDAMVDGLSDLGPMLRSVAGDSPWAAHRPTPDEIIAKLRDNGIDDLDL